MLCLSLLKHLGRVRSPVEKQRAKTEGLSCSFAKGLSNVRGGVLWPAAARPQADRSTSEGFSTALGPSWMLSDKACGPCDTGDQPNTEHLSRQRHRSSKPLRQRTSVLRGAIGTASRTGSRTDGASA